MAKLGVVPIKADFTKPSDVISEWLQRFGKAGAVILAAQAAVRGAWHWVHGFGVPSCTDRSGRGMRML